MTEFFTRKGDDGYTGLLGKGRYPKEGERLEALGAVDEITSVLGFARSLCKAPGMDAILLEVQRHLYILMSELAAIQENTAKFSVISDEHVDWLEEQLARVQESIDIPKEFILPGDTVSGAALDMARTVTRRAERRVAALFHTSQASQHVLRYLNRLSSLCYILELREYQFGGNERLTPAHSPR